MTFQMAKKILKMPLKGLKIMAQRRGISVPGLIQDANKAVKKGLAKSKVASPSQHPGGGKGRQALERKGARRPQSLSGSERQELTRAKASIIRKKR